jgi:CBS domain-containing protein
MEILDRIDDPHFTNEIGQFNLEINLDPMLFQSDCLSRMERQLSKHLARLRAVAADSGSEIALTGILPTLRKSDLDLSNMTPRPRYYALNDALYNLRRSSYELRINGTDEFIFEHDSMMLEACCTSFQVHLQVDPENFTNSYNAAQMITAPVLAAATNSPLLFGRRLWKETRIPLFEQGIDTRKAGNHLRERSPRVSFGQRWVKQSPLELFEEDIARFRILLGARLDEDPFEMLNQGLAPALKALRVYNSTIWRWNRACYGITDGKPHLRIEARSLPSGPTIIDEVANAAFFCGLVTGFSSRYDDIASVMEFDDVKTNFMAAARLGLDAQLTWLDGKVTPARELICRDLLPIAREGLLEAGILPSDIARYLGVIEERVKSGRTGAQWLVSSMSKMKSCATRDEILTALVAGTIRRQQEDKPAHEWSLVELTEGVMSKPSYLRVEEFMTTDLFTVHEDEPLELVANLMDWKHVRHIPVEDEHGRLVGLISCFEVLRQLERDISLGEATPTPVSSIMNKEPVTIPPETLTLEAIAIMRQNHVACLPVVKDGRLVGIVAERDFITVAARLLEQRLRE